VPLLAAATVLATLTAGCTVTVTDPPASTPALSASPTARSSAPPASPTATRHCSGPLAGEASACYNVADANGAPAGLITDISSTDWGTQWEGGVFEQTLAADGSMAATRRPPDTDVILHNPTEVGLWDRFGFHLLATVRNTPPRQVIAMDREGKRLAWMETTSTQVGFDDWWVRYAAGGKTVTLASSSELGLSRDDFGVDAQISLVGDTVYWTSVYREKAGKTDSAAILSKNVNGPGTYRVLATDAFMPVSNGHGTLFFLADNGPTAAIKSVVPGKAPAMVTPQACVHGYIIAAMGADATHVAWAVMPDPADASTPPAAYRSWIYVLDLTTSALTEVATTSDGTDGIPVSGGWMAWGNGSGNGSGREFLMNLASGAITLLDDSPGLSEAAVNYPTVVWREEAADAGAPVPLKTGVIVGG